jgi:hypothetical protein
MKKIKKKRTTVKMIDYYGPEKNDGKHVFVFGSNRAGRHGMGAALTASLYWGAQRGVGEGRTGQAYGIPTKNENLEILGLEEIAESIKKFIDYASEHPKLTFLVTKVGCGLSKYKDKDIGPLFKGAGSNCILPDGWG